MDELHSVLREGLREEAAPISRRLAEVKGLSNNAVRRLDRIESTLDAERLARIDDLALLVELLTEGWRSLNVRLARIEAALDAAPARVVPLRETGSLTGSTSSKRLPRPTSLCSSSRPPSAVESSRAIGSPSPVPPPTCETNGRKIRSRL